MRAARRHAFVLSLLLVPVLASGCFVFDEIDKGMEIMEAHTPKDKKKKEGEAKPGKEAEKPPTYAQKTQAWWQNAKSLSTAPGEEDASADPIVNCRHSGRTQFMKKSDCMLRGGDPS